jgi:cardiolipin synthase
MSVIMNNRDHRKIFVVDGKVGYTGGINLADEYINKIERFGYWKDTGVRLEGEAVWGLTTMFLEMWNYIKNTSEDYECFLPAVHQTAPFESDGFVQPYGDSPLDHENVGENVYLNIIGRAKKYVYIFTPYLIIDNEMLISLCNAAKSGIDVRIVTPGIPDKKAVYLLTQSYYAPLLSSGVRIYQYTPGFIHAKSFVCDDEIATVGSINLDFRSLYLHFECGVFMYRTGAVMQLKEDCLRTFEESEEITLEFCRKRNIFVRMIQSVARLFAPLL